MMGRRRRHLCAFVVGLLVLTLLGGCAPTAVPVSPPAASPAAADVAPTAAPSPAATAMAMPWTPGQLEVHLLDVGHGDAQLIVSPTGETMLIDCGRVEYAPKIARYLTEVLGEPTVDYLMMSHYHMDHLGAFVPLVRDEGLTIRKAILDRGGGRDELSDSAFVAYYDYLTDPAHRLRRVRVRPGDEIDLGSRISVSVLAVGDVDTRTNAGVPVVAENDNSIALWLRFGRFDYFTAGDLSGEASSAYADIESAVIPLLPGQADAMKANHHCQPANNRAEFIAALNPQAILVSGNNSVVRWQPLTRLEKHCPVYITSSDIVAHKGHGDIVLTSRDGEQFTIEGDLYISR